MVFICLPSDRQARAAAMVHKHGREELPHVRGQGQRPRVPGCYCAGMAERSYPASEVRGGGRPGGATRLPRPGAVAGRSYPTSEVRGSGRECQAATAQEQTRGATPHLRSGAAAGRSYPTSEVRGGGQPGGATPCPMSGRQLKGAAPCPRSGGCMGAGGPRGATPRSRSGGAAVRRYPHPR